MTASKRGPVARDGSVEHLAHGDAVDRSPRPCRRSRAPGRTGAGRAKPQIPAGLPGATGSTWSAQRRVSGERASRSSPIIPPARPRRWHRSPRPSAPQGPFDVLELALGPARAPGDRPGLLFPRSRSYRERASPGGARGPQLGALNPRRATGGSPPRPRGRAATR